LILILERSYHKDGTNGKLKHGDRLVCSTIELPWFQNKRNVSCIPEGRYQLVKRHTAKRSDHLRLAYVPNRDWILFHPANDAKTELEGCIAPVTKLIGNGKGSSSRKALKKLHLLVFEAFSEGENVQLIIKKEIEMNVVNRIKSPTPKFFRVLRMIGLSLATAGGVILASPVLLPASIVALGGYLAVGGGVLTAVSQATVEEEQTPNV
jgi:hypothetical protein